MTTTVTEAIYRMNVDGYAAVDAAARSVDGLAVSEEKLTRATRATEQGFERLMGRLDPAIRAHQQYQQALERVEKFTAAGIGTDADRARAVELITQRYQQSLGAIGRHSQVVNDNTKRVGLNAYEMRNLGFQLNDVATMLASGSSPFQVMATQSGQVFQILQGSQGGVTGAIKGLAASVTAFLGPLGLMAVGFAAVTAAAVAFYQLTKTEAPTAEKLLTEHDRLLKIVKDSYDKVTNSAKNWYDQSKAVTQLLLLQQEIELQKKLTEEIDKQTRKLFEVDFAKSGNMSFGYKIKEDYKSFSDAIYNLAESYQKGTPNVKAFTDEVAKIALAQPALQKLGAELVNSVGDASKFAQVLQQTRDMLAGLQSGTFTTDQRGRLGLGDPAKAKVNEYDQLIQRTKDRIEQLKLEAQTAGQTGEAVLKLRLQHEAERAARKAGVTVNQQYIDQLKEEYAAADRLARIASIRADIAFDRATVGLSPADVQIAQQLREIYGNDIPAALASSEAAAMRLTDAMREGFQGVSDVVKGVFTALLTGKNAMDALIAGLDRLADKLANAAFENLLTGALTGNPVQMAIGAAQAGGALIATAFGNNLKLQKAREEWEKAGPAFEKFISTLSGGIQGAISQQFEQLRSQAEQFIDKALKAQDFGAINRVLTAFSDAVIRETTAFRESFEGMLAGLEDGLGPSSPFASAAQRIKSITDELQGFIDDARISFANDPIALAAGNNPLVAGGGETQVRSATEAAQQYLLSLLGAKPELSATATAIQEMQGTAVALRAALVELGMTSDQAAAAISDGVTAAMAELASKFSNDLQREINDALGQGYLNEFADLMKKRQQALDDAARLGTGTALVDRWFQVSAQKIINDAGLAGSAIASLVALFPELGGVVKDSNAALRAAVEAAEAEVERARTALEQAYQREVSALDSVISRMKSFIDQFTKFRDSLWLNPNLSVLSPEQRLLEAQRQFRDVAALAAQGDETALGKLQDVSQAYLDEAKSFYASTEQYYAAFMEVQGVLEAAEDAANRQLSTAQQQLSALNQQVAGLIAINNSVLSVEAAINNLTLAQSNLAAAMANLNNARDWGLRPEINRLLVEGLQAQGINYTGGFGSGEFGAWRATQSQAVNDIISAIEQSIPQSLIDFYARQNKVAPFQPAYASGTDFHPGGLAWVGEQGRELVNLPRGSQVIPNDILRGFAGRGAADNRELVAEVKALRQEVAALRGDTRAGAVHVREGVDQAANRTERVSAAARQQANRPRGYGTRGAA